MPLPFYCHLNILYCRYRTRPGLRRNRPANSSIRFAPLEFFFAGGTAMRAGRALVTQHTAPLAESQGPIRQMGPAALELPGSVQCPAALNNGGFQPDNGCRMTVIGASGLAPEEALSEVAWSADGARLYAGGQYQHGRLREHYPPAQRFARAALHSKMLKIRAE
jgi:hypothetical protein